MAITYRLVRDVPDPVSAVAIAVPSDRVGDDALDLDWDYLERVGFTGRSGQVATLRVGEGPVVFVFGCGPSDALGPVVLRRAVAPAARAARVYESLAVEALELLPDGADVPACAQALVEGVALATYSFDRYKGEPKPAALADVAVIGRGGRRVRDALDRGSAVADAVCLARDLVNEPGGALTPQAFAREARRVARRERLRIEVLDEAAIRREGMGGLLAVNRGSTQPPRYLRIAYAPRGASRTVALVGKGITFDSGGLSLKTADGMKTMKDDMGGAAAVLGAMSALRAVGVEVAVRAYLPLTDNMPGGDAQRVGDVLTTRSGTTVEVLNTDAEGRLVLADALADAVEGEPDAIVDLATLTGACMVSLGLKIAGVMGTDEAWVGQVLDASATTGERAWWLPLPREYRKDLDSDIADLKNIGGAYGGALTAGLFLREFVGGVPWAHIDIAGPAWAQEVDAEIVKGGTGFGVRLLLELLTSGEIPAATPATKKAPAKRKAPAKKRAPAKRKAPAKKRAPAKRKAPAKKKAPAKRKAPAKKRAPAKRKAPAKKKAPARKKAPAKKRAPAKR